jgi:hypothetical protein
MENILAVSGLPGLYKLVNSRSNGLVVSDLKEEKTRFCSVRKHQFTPLETVAIYTYADSVELPKIFDKIKASSEAIPDIKKASGSELESYFRSVLPEFDEDRVYTSDIKKVIKWYGILKEHDLLDAKPSDEEE